MEDSDNSSTSVDNVIGILVYRIEFSHLVLINVAIILPALIHFMETLTKPKKEQCNNFIECIMFGCLLASLVWILGMSFILFSHSTDARGFMCSSYKLVPNIIMIWMVKCTVLHHVFARVNNRIVKAFVKCISVSWAVFAVVVQVMLSEMDLRKCVPSVLLYSNHSTRSAMTSHGLSALIVLNSVMFIPPAILIMVAYLWNLFRRHNMKSRDAIDIYDEMCPTCARTLNVFDQCWWKFVLCFTIAIVRTYVLLNNWFNYHTFRDFPPMVIIALMFYPVVFAQSVNHLKIYDTGRLWKNQVKHV